MMPALLFLKAMVAGHIKADGTVVRTYHRRDDRSLNARYARVIAAAKRAHDALPWQVQDALERWQNAAWDLNPLQAAYRGDPKRAALRQEMEEAMRPVRRVLREQFGETIILHRGERHYDGAEEQPRALYSWTLDPGVAADFARRARPFRAMPQAEIDRIVASYEAKGYAKSGRKRWMRSKENPEYYWIYDRREVITDGEDLRGELERTRAEMLERNAEIIARGRIYTEAIPVEHIAWVFPDTSQREFLVARPPHRTPPPGAS
jgi:hypothetical protein